MLLADPILLLMSHMSYVFSLKAVEVGSQSTSPLYLYISKLLSEMRMSLSLFEALFPGWAGLGEICQTIEVVGRLHLALYLMLSDF